MAHAVILPLDPAAASDADLAGCYETAIATYVVDYPDRPVPTLEAYVSRLAQPETFFGPQQFWAAWVDGRVRGLATMMLPNHENLHTALAKVQVAPAFCRSGIGTALLHAMLPAVQSAGRTTVIGRSLKIGGSGEMFARALGFSFVQQITLQMLHVPDIDPKRWHIPVPSGFRIVSWVGGAPDSLVAGYAEARSAITDAPLGESTFDFPEWSVERVRKHELSADERGQELRVVVVQDVASGDVAGFTEIELNLTRPDVVLQMDTAVRRTYRGLGLGKLIKAHMMLWLLSDKPEVERVATGTAADNVHMIRVNTELGYTTDYEVADAEISLDALLASTTRSA